MRICSHHCGSGLLRIGGLLRRRFGLCNQGAVRHCKCQKAQHPKSCAVFQTSNLVNECVIELRCPCHACALALRSRSLTVEVGMSLGMRIHWQRQFGSFVCASLLALGLGGLTHADERADKSASDDPKTVTPIKHVIVL